MKEAGKERRAGARRLIALALLAGWGLAGGARAEGEIVVGGYVRGYAGWNLDDPQEVPGNDRWRNNMLRGQVYLEASGTHPALQWKLAGRLAREARTSYLEDLEDQTRGNPMFGDPGFDVTRIYNKQKLREAWVQFQPTDTLNVKFGRQQVVWGETDIFQALDVIHGYDYTWAPLLEEPDETRKPLILLNTTLSVPAADGSLQFVLRPGWDSEDDIGSTWDVYGGRARSTGYKGASSWYGAGADFSHPEGDKDDVTYALRWKQTLGGLNYHLSYVKAHYTRNPIANSALAPWKKAPEARGGLFNWVTPIVDVVGAGANAYLQSIDTVLTGELVYTHGEPFNVGSIPGGAQSGCVDGTFGAGASAAPTLSSLSGTCGIKRKDTLMTMLRAEKTFDSRAIGASGTTSVSVQLFNTRILGYREADDLVLSIGYPDRVKRDSTTATLVVRTPWLNDTLTSTVAFGRDFSYQGAFAAFALDYELGASWRLRGEVDLFDGRESIEPTPYGNAAGMAGLLDRSDRLVLRATYQF